MNAPPPRPALRRWAAGLVAAALLALALPVAAQALLLRDDRGVEHRFAAPPQRIVSLMPSLTECVFALGGGARIVGVDRYANWPPEVKRLPQLGGLDDALIEAIAALKPDVVLASTAARSLDRLEALGFTVLRLKSDSHADVQRTLGLLGRLLGTPQAGPQVWAGIEAELAAAAAKVPAALRGQRVYFEIGGGPYAAGQASFIGQTLTALGLAHIVPADLGPFPKLNPEFVLRAQPDIVMALTRDLSGMAARPGWAALRALQARRQCGFDAETYEMLTRPGPRLGQGAQVLADCLHGLGMPR
ncbi:MAG: helical backbone metal receptor [Rubrivivax sp.]|nr:helical backbone metal receptor [Rubrivivax sp.]